MHKAASTKHGLAPIFRYGHKKEVGGCGAGLLGVGCECYFVYLTITIILDGCKYTYFVKYCLL